MTESIFKIISNRALNQTISEMVLEGDTSALTRSGQFVNIKLDGLYLRRPISVCDYSEGKLTLVYRAVGEGTRRMREMTEGSLNILVGLGNGYDTSLSGDAPLLVGGGVGIPPLYNLCRRLIAEGKSVRVLLGFRNASDVFYEEEFKALGASVTVVTEDGTAGKRGFVTAYLDDAPYTYIYSCGPEPMLKALSTASVTSGQYSFEERMGCGFGACMGCSCKTLTGYKRICKDGPVMRKEEILWQK